MITMFHDDMTLEEILESVLYMMTLEKTEDTLANRLKYLKEVRDDWSVRVNPKEDREFANDFLIVCKEINRLELLCLRLQYKGEAYRIYDICETDYCE
jgi:hypothetical protein